jgi:hypothetical protein
MLRQVALFAGICLAAAAVSAAPELSLSELSFDFGYVPQNSNVSHVFWLKSTGDDTLIIQRVIPGCGCTKAPLEKNILAAGDSTRLEIIFSSQRYKGSVVKHPIVQTNADTSRRPLKFSTKVVAHPDSLRPVIVKPYKLDISQLGEEIRDRISFTIENLSEQDVTIRLVAVPDELVTLTLPKTVAAHGSASGELVVREDKLTEEFQKSFTFEVGGADTARYTVPIRRAVPGLKTSSTD